MEVQTSLRYRVNVSTSVKGIKTFDCTVEGDGYEMSTVLELSDLLVKELEKRYPISEVLK
jgi:hypothetical protein